MKNRILTSLLAFWASLIFLVPLTSFAQDITPKCSSVNGVRSCIVTFDSGSAIDTISTAIPACHSNLVTFEKSSTAAVSLYAAPTTATNAAAIEATTLVNRFTLSDKYGPFNTDKGTLRFVVDTAETSAVASFAKVTCSDDIESVGWVKKFLCSGEADTGVCENADGDIVWDVRSLSSVALEFGLSSGTFSCDVYGNNNGVVSVGVKLNGVSFDASNRGSTLYDPPGYIWINCSTISGGTVTASALGRTN